MFFIVGLGNPGAEYEWTRHNRALVGNASVEGSKVLLVKPQTYMNLSGEPVTCLLAKQEEARPAKDLIVISDDLALPFGTIRLRPRGSAGGHNGLKSIAALGTEEFTRLRIGIKPEHPLSDTKRFVLDEFPRSERERVAEVLERSAEALHAVLRDGIDKAMATYNSDK